MRLMTHLYDLLVQKLEAVKISCQWRKVNWLFRSQYADQIVISLSHKSSLDWISIFSFIFKNIFILRKEILTCLFSNFSISYFTFHFINIIEFNIIMQLYSYIAFRNITEYIYCTEQALVDWKKYTCICSVLKSTKWFHSRISWK